MIAGGPLGGLRRPLTLEDREEISRCLAMCLTNKEIAAHIERDESVVCREIARNGGGRNTGRTGRRRGRRRSDAAQKPGRWTLIRCCAHLGPDRRPRTTPNSCSEVREGI